MGRSPRKLSEQPADKFRRRIWARTIKRLLLPSSDHTRPQISDINNVLERRLKKQFNEVPSSRWSDWWNGKSGISEHYKNYFNKVIPNSSIWFNNEDIYSQLHLLFLSLDFSGLTVLKNKDLNGLIRFKEEKSWWVLRYLHQKWEPDEYGRISPDLLTFPTNWTTNLSNTQKLTMEDWICPVTSTYIHNDTEPFYLLKAPANANAVFDYESPKTIIPYLITLLNDSTIFAPSQLNSSRIFTTTSLLNNNRQDFHSITDLVNRIVFENITLDLLIAVIARRTIIYCARKKFGMNYLHYVRDDKLFEIIGNIFFSNEESLYRLLQNLEHSVFVDEENIELVLHIKKLAPLMRNIYNKLLLDIGIEESDILENENAFPNTYPVTYS
ncbi:MAG: hypothetical protein QM484_11390 [Woeseiaceae bacterium]